VFDSSWNMLGEPERRLFRWLSIFRGGFTRAAAEAVGGEMPWAEEDAAVAEDGTLQLRQRQPPVLAALARLVDKSFVRHTPSGRYEIHELMRQYGVAKLLQRPEEEREARDNHAR
jgi:predicted ATPase